VTIDTVMWLFVVVFVIHEFEEIIMLKPWLTRNRSELMARFPGVAKRTLGLFDRLSTPAIAFAILEQLVILVLVVLLSVTFGWYDVWAGLVSGYLIHIVGHLVQWAAYRKYCPFVFSSILSIPYCLWALIELYDRELISVAWHSLWVVIAVVLIGINLKLAHRIAGWFEGWLSRHYNVAAEHN
jgi:hypothetical protein